MAPPKQCFISYSHQDCDGFEQLRSHLGAVANLYGVTLEHDRTLRAGQYWDNALREKIENSQIFVPLFSNKFYSSEYIFRHEMPAMLERHRHHNALLVPVIYQESCWRQVFGNYIEVSPKNPKHNLTPVCQWRDREQAFAVAANAISKSIEDWFGIKPSSHFTKPGGGPT
jgi:hypothetical protein